MNRGLQPLESCIRGTDSGDHDDVPAGRHFEGSQYLPQLPLQTVADHRVANPLAYGQPESGVLLSRVNGVDDEYAIGGPPSSGTDRPEFGLPPQALLAMHNWQP